MSPFHAFLIRLVAALVGSYLISFFFFGRAELTNVLLLAAFILVAAYGMKAVRGRPGSGR